MSYFSNGEQGKKLTLEVIVLDLPGCSMFSRQYRSVKGMIYTLTTVTTTFCYIGILMGKENEVECEEYLL